MVWAIERPLQNLANAAFRGKSPYQVIRTMVFVTVMSLLFRKLRHVANREGLFPFVTALIAPYLKKLPFVRAQLDKELEKTMSGLRKKFQEELSEPRLTLPAAGIPRKELLDLMAQRKDVDTKHWVDGKVTGSVYHGGQDHYDFIGQVFAKWGFCNPLHPAIHPALRQMDSEVVQMVVNLYNGGPEACGCFTTGGTESILMAMKAYRDWGYAEKGITDPNIVVCSTAHAAFWKAGKYFKIWVKTARPDSDMSVDVRHVRQLIDSNTVAIVGSACQFSHGNVDPIEELGALALQKRVGLHVDCCLGGFLVPFMEEAGFPIRPFDFRVKGVTSISCDPHKYGFAPKGSSVIMFSNRSLRHHMYCYQIDWSGGIYATTTMTGSRAGGPVAATWAAMCTFGREGYVKTTKEIVAATRRIGEGIRQIEGLVVVGKPEVCVVAFTGAKGSGLSPYAVSDCMKSRFGWELQTCQNPPCSHLAVTLPSAKNAEQFLLDLREAVKLVKTDSSKFSSTAGMYGMAASLPSTFLEDAAGAYLDAMTEAIAAKAA